MLQRSRGPPDTKTKRSNASSEGSPCFATWLLRWWKEDLEVGNSRLKSLSVKAEISVI